MYNPAAARGVGAVADSQRSCRTPADGWISGAQRPFGNRHCRQRYVLQWTHRQLSESHAGRPEATTYCSLATKRQVRLVRRFKALAPKVVTSI